MSGKDGVVVEGPPKAMPSRRDRNYVGLLRDYGTAVAFVVLASVITYLMSDIRPERSQSLIVFFAAVALSAGYRGVGPGLAATLLSALSYDFFFLPPYHSLTVTGSDLTLLILFVLVGVLINALTGRLQADTKAADRRFQVAAQELAALNSITAAVSASLELSTVLDTLQQQLGGQLKIPGGCILLCDDEDQMRAARSWGLSPQLCERMAALRSDDLYELDPDQIGPAGVVRASHLSSVTERETGPPEWRDQVCVPLLANGRLEGALLLFGFQDAELTANRNDFCGTLGRQIGVLIQNARLYEQLRAGQANLHQLSRQLVSVQEAERREIARELHDEVGQMLTGLKLSVEMSLRLPSEAAGDLLRQALTLVNELMAHVQDLSLNLRPAMLDDLGLLPTLLWHFDRYSISTGIRVHYEHSGIERRFPAEIETTVYRMVQEALTNVARHAGVTEATVRLWTTQGTLCIQVTDQGCGFALSAMAARAGAGGLAGMQERVTLLGGDLTIESSPGSGVRLLAELPLDDTMDAAHEEQR